jgi:antitoxin (DNA-binding transcriptional repressor) of toxin-antitoxin stability system
MKELNVREMRASIGRLDDLVDAAGELIVSRRGRPIARILPVSRRRQRPDHADLRARMPPVSTPSEDLIRDERNER